MRYTILFTALIFGLSFSACNNDDITIEEVRGTVLLGTAANGFEDCGYLVVIDGENYVPNTLVSQFRIDGLEVFMQVEFLDIPSDCGSQATPPQRLRIEQIREIE